MDEPDADLDDDRQPHRTSGQLADYVPELDDPIPAPTATATSTVEQAPEIDASALPEEPEIDEDDIVEVLGADETVEAAMRELFAMEVRRVASSALAATLRRERAAARARAVHEARAHAQLAAEVEARARIAAERDGIREALAAQLATLCAGLRLEHGRRLAAEARALEATALTRHAQDCLARERSARARTPRGSTWRGAIAGAMVALLAMSGVLGVTEHAGALLRAPRTLSLPSESAHEARLVAAGPGTKVSIAPPAKPTAHTGPAASAVPERHKPRLARARRAPAAAPPPAVAPPAARPPAPTASDDPLGGLDGLDL